MELIIYLLVLTLTLMFVIVTSWRRRRRGFPPGPPCIPVFGSLPFIDKIGVQTITDPKYHKYGDIVEFDFLMKSVFVFNDFKLAKELFARDDLAGREIDYYNRNIRGHNNEILGIVATSDEVWKHQRRFALKTLKDFGFGKHALDSAIQEEVTYLINDLVEEIDKSGRVLISTTFNTAIINVLWMIVANKRFDPKDQQTKDLMNMLNEIFKTSIINIYSLAPFLRMFGPRLGKEKSVLKLKEMIRKQVVQHEEEFDPDVPPRDFIEHYIAETKKENHDVSFHREQLVTICLDFFEAGTETSSTTLMWAFLYLCLHQDVQEKCQKEIDEVLGEAIPDKDDASRLVYVSAMIMEVQRISCVAAASLPHRALEDIHTCGYFIPKGSMCFSNLRKFLHDPEIFPEPNRFNPERFVKDGKIEKPEQFVPFGLGKRYCMGDSLAKQELFIFLAMILQRVKISPLADKALTPNPQEFTMEVTTIPKPFYVKVTRR